MAKTMNELIVDSPTPSPHVAGYASVNFYLFLMDYSG